MYKENRYSLITNCTSKKINNLSDLNIFGMNINIPFIYPDEQLNSWLERVAKSNGLKGSFEFYETFILKQDKRLRKNDYLNWNNINLPVGLILNRLDYKGNYALFIKHHTSLAVLSMIINPYSQALQMRSLFGGRRMAPIKKLPDYNTCPFCQKENFYIRVWHNLPNVKVCAIHKCALIDKNGELYKDIRENDYKYAKYCYELYQIQPDINIRFLFNNIRGIEFADGINRLTTKYPNVEEIPKVNIPLNIDNDYEVLFSDNNISEFYHKKCGNVFCINKLGFNFGYKCPYCEQDEEKIYISKINNKDYILKKYANDTLTIEHLKCGKVQNIRTKTYFKNGYICDCTKLTIKENFYKDLDSSASNEFEIISYSDNKRYVTVKHIPCGIIQNKNIYHWRLNFECKHCAQIKKQSKKIKEKIDKYKIIALNNNQEFINFEKNKNKLIIYFRCSNGHTFAREQYKYIHNNECPICKKKGLINAKKK